MQSSGVGSVSVDATYRGGCAHVAQTGAVNVGTRSARLTHLIPIRSRHIRTKEGELCDEP